MLQFLQLLSASMDFDCIDILQIHACVSQTRNKSYMLYLTC